MLDVLAFVLVSSIVLSAAPPPTSGKGAFNQIVVNAFINIIGTDDRIQILPPTT